VHLQHIWIGQNLAHNGTKYWGFYMVAVPDANGVGVRDFQDALDDFALYDT